MLVLVKVRFYGAKVVGYDKAERTHTVVYVVDEIESSEALRDGGIRWRPAAPGDITFFLSHSWADSARGKWDALRSLLDEESARRSETDGEVLLWLE